MSRGLYVALSGAVAQETALDTTAQNLANAATPGYQRMRPVFKEVLSGATGKNNPGSNLHFTSVDATALDGSRGALRATGRALDVALPEGVYLGVSTARGERYTRAGSLTVQADGSLTTSSGKPIAREDGSPLKVTPGRETTIKPDGTVVQDGNAVGSLRLVKMEAGGSLEHEGEGLLVAKGTPPVAAAATLDIGALEESNASVVGSMTELVQASRTFEVFQKMLDTFGEMDRKVLTTVPNASD
jgi:flagellar basal-body rod protein FlgF